MEKYQNNLKWEQVLAIILVATFVLALSGTALGLSKRDLKRTDKNGPVTVIAIFLNPIEKSKESSLRFEVKLDTHSVDLDQYQLEDITYIKFDNGIEQKSNSLIKKGSGHHIVNVLTFSGSVPEGAKKMTLIIRNLGDVAERLLEWELPIK